VPSVFEYGFPPEEPFSEEVGDFEAGEVLPPSFEVFAEGSL
jgi:hypothetical protein